jgi:LacI family transcriptional regulator
MFKGIFEFANRNSDWRCIPLNPDREHIEQLKETKPDGILGDFYTREIALMARSIGVPTVELTDAYDKPVFPRVIVDSLRIGRQAAEHFLSAGYRHFAFVGGQHDPWATDRLASFSKCIGEAGFSTQTFDSTTIQGIGWANLSLGLNGDQFRNWLAKLPKPCAVFGACDYTAYTVLDAAFTLGIQVPGEMAVLGVDNDALVCELALPSLSSIATNTMQVGFEAAALLAKLMNGESAPDKPIRIPPAEVVTRRSTDMIALDDSDVAEALRYIRREASTGIEVRDVALHVSLSRRTLERRFRSSLRQGIQEEIVRTRVAAACHLLRTTSLPVADIGRRAGFNSQSQMFRSFKLVQGSTPRDYRLQFQIPG